MYENVKNNTEISFTILQVSDNKYGLMNQLESARFSAG